MEVKSHQYDHHGRSALVVLMIMLEGSSLV
jgi:hypothetical protein